MEIRALVSIIGNEQTYSITLEYEPKIGDTITLHVDEADKEFVVVEVNPTGFINSPPYLYGLHVESKN